MPASDFEAIEVPNIGSYGRMVPVHKQAPVGNVGAAWALTAYTVPSGRILALDWAQLVCYSGTLPTYMVIQSWNDSGVMVGRLVREAVLGVNRPIHLTNTIWLASGWTLRFAIGGGDATTDMVWAFAGRLFDWTDFAA